MQKTTIFSRILLVFIIFLLVLPALSSALQYTVYRYVDDYARAMDACPSQRKVVRISNGTLYCTLFPSDLGDRIAIIRSVDNGQTWYNWSSRADSAWSGDYDPCLVVDSKDVIHWAWARSVADGMGIQYSNWSADGHPSRDANGWWQAFPAAGKVYNISKNNTHTEDVVMVVNKSDAVYFFWYDYFQELGKIYNIQNRTLYKGVWGRQCNFTSNTNSTNTFMSTTVDFNDVVHIVWINSLKGVEYANITNNVRSNIRHMGLNAGPCITNDFRNDLQLVWTYQTGGLWYTKYSNYTFKNQSWCTPILLRLSGAGKYPSATFDHQYTFYVVWSGTDGERYMACRNGSWTTERILTKNFDTQDNAVLYANYPRFVDEATGGWIYTMRPKTGFSVTYSNASGPKGAGFPSVGYFNNSTGYYGKTGSPFKQSNFAPYSVTTTTATLKARVTGAGITNAKCGFLIGNENPVLYTNRLWNVTSSCTPDTNDYFYYNITGLSKTTYYYVRSWMQTNGEMTYGNQTYMLTASAPASLLTVKSMTAASVTLQWLTPTLSSGLNASKAVCRYSSGTAPTTPQSGTAGFNATVRNGCVNSSTVTGLSPGNTYNFSLWIYVEDSGSPLLHAFSSYITSSAFTPGGTYNISFKYENSSYHPVDFSKCGGTENVTKTAERTIRAGSGYTYTTATKTIVLGPDTGQWISLLSSYYESNTSSMLEAFNTTLYDWVTIQPMGTTNGSWINANDTYKVKPYTVRGDIVWTAFRLTYKITASIGVFSSTTHINLTTPNDDESFCQLEAYNTTYFTWYVIQSYRTCNGTINANNTYTVPAGTVHGGWRSYRLTYQSKVTATRCTLILHYSNLTEYNYFGYTNGATGYRSIQTSGDFNKTYKSYVLLNLSYTPLWFEFYWNTTKDSYRCYRMLVTEPNTKNYTFYISTNKPVHNASSTTFINHLVDYTIQVIDGVGNLNIPPGNFSVWAYLYTFDDDGTRMIIHSEYVDGQSQIYPELLYTKDYFIGVKSPYYIFDAFARFRCTETTTQTTTVVMTNNTYEMTDLTLKCGWVDSTGGIWCYYFDGNNKITGAWFRVYDFNNNTLGNLLYGDNSNVYTNNFTYVAANHSRSYRLSLTLNFSGYSYHYNLTLFKNDTSLRRFSGSHINQLMNLTFGFSPFRRVDNPDIYVHWVDVIIFFISVFLVCSFPGQSAGLCGLVVGGIDVALGSLISGASVLLIPAGVIIFIFSLLYLWRGKQ